MKLLCYGASVTAQKFETGFYQQLFNSELINKFELIERVAFGASQFEYAGYAFMQDVIDKNPNVCIIDWLTPGMKSFSEYKIVLLNRALLEINCLPIWVFFPRINNFDEPHEAYYQVKTHAELFSLPFIDVRKHMDGFSSAPTKYLRDAVHTTLEGAQLYSKVIEESLFKLDIIEKIRQAKDSEGFVLSGKQNHSVPIVAAANYRIDDTESLQIDVNYCGGFFEIFFETEVGPHLCKLLFEVYQDDKVCYQEQINPADPWSYYTRKMVVETFRRRIPPGQYTIKVSKEKGNPFDLIETKKPTETDWNDVDRFIQIQRVSLNSNSAELKSIEV